MKRLRVLIARINPCAEPCDVIGLRMGQGRQSDPRACSQRRTPGSNHATASSQTFRSLTGMRFANVASWVARRTDGARDRTTADQAAQRALRARGVVRPRATRRRAMAPRSAPPRGCVSGRQVGAGAGRIPVRPYLRLDRYESETFLLASNRVRAFK
jgi:hypothetical protein